MLVPFYTVGLGWFWGVSDLDFSHLHLLSSYFCSLRPTHTHTPKTLESFSYTVFFFLIPLIPIVLHSFSLSVKDGVKPCEGKNR